MYLPRMLLDSFIYNYTLHLLKLVIFMCVQSLEHGGLEL